MSRETSDMMDMNGETTNAIETSLDKNALEVRGIERIPSHARSHVRIFDNFTMWLSANLIIPAVALGTLASPIFHLGFWDGLAIIFVFNILGILPVAFFSTLGPKLGLRQITISRFSFGWHGTIGIAFLNAITCIITSALNVIIGGQVIAAFSGYAIQVWLGILIITVCTSLISIYGYKYVHRYERYAWLPTSILLMVLFALSLFHFHLSLISAPHLSITWLSFGAAVYGFAIACSSYAADYTVYQPEDTCAHHVFWLTCFGNLVPSVFLETLGMLLASSPALSNLPIGSLLAEVMKPLGMARSLLLIIPIFSVIACNILSDYSFGLSMQLLSTSFQRISRVVWTCIGSIVYFVIALLASNNFSQVLNDALLLIAYWVSPWAMILVLEHFFFRQGHYNVDEWNIRQKLPSGWAALLSLLCGFVGAFLGAALALTFHGATLALVGPLARLLNPPSGTDIGFELALLFASLSYLLLRPIELKLSSR